jgi:hypothetical protein
MSELDRRRSVVERVLGGSPLGVIVRLVITSFVVGLVLRALDVRPGDIVRWMQARIEDLSNIGYETVQEALGILVLGAVVVVPIWLVIRLVRLLSR